METSTLRAPPGARNRRRRHFAWLEMAGSWGPPRESLFSIFAIFFGDFRADRRVSDDASFEDMEHRLHRAGIHAGRFLVGPAQQHPVEGRFLGTPANQTQTVFLGR